MNYQPHSPRASLRRELKAWLKVNLPPWRERQAWNSPDAEVLWRSRLRWHQRLFRGGWLGMSWPRAYGGRGLGTEEELLVLEELAAHGAPSTSNLSRIAVDVVAPLLMRYGTPEQKTGHLKRMLGALESWCLCLTERESGSDFIAVKTTAVEAGGVFQLDGEKLWITFAHKADFALVLARTDLRVARPWLALSYFIVDLRSPGISVRPIPQITGQSEFNEVRFANVRVPKENLVGPWNGGWRISASLLPLEGLMLYEPYALRRDLGNLLRLLRRSPARGSLWSRPLARAAIEAAALRLLAHSAHKETQQQTGMGDSASIIKIRGVELKRRLQEMLLDLGGLPELTKPSSSLAYLNSLGERLRRGTREVHKNLIARLVMGLTP